jgi:hypothetical protein
MHKAPLVDARAPLLCRQAEAVEPTYAGSNQRCGSISTCRRRVSPWYTNICPSADQDGSQGRFADVAVPGRVARGLNRPGNPQIASPALLHCRIGGHGELSCVWLSDRQGELSERGGDPEGGVRVDSDFVVATAEVLGESESGNDDLGAAVGA